MREAPFDIVGGLWASDDFSGSGSSKVFGGFFVKGLGI
jgi:hypothetical protein